MKLIVGLGNPGLDYTNTRHNLGFMVVGVLSDNFRTPLKRSIAYNCLKTRLDFKGVDFVLCKPLSYMNLSGKVVAALAIKYKLTPQDLLIICDDINLELGRIKIKAKGSAGGHKGLESIIKSLGQDEFTRLRIGITSPKGKGELSDYVLSPFAPAEFKVVLKSISLAKEAALHWLESGVNKTMNKFNQLKHV